ncbi:MAG: cobalamin biosynthesis protein, partial [Blastochloris sp.]|nr:cobalamin biosynthesis protein [Blastochloris sp.]
QVARRDAGRTASPNAGWPMAAMAGALNTTLTKRDHYSLGAGSTLADAALIADARRIARLVWLLIVLGAAILALQPDRNALQEYCMRYLHKERR